MSAISTPDPYRSAVSRENHRVRGPQRITQGRYLGGRYYSAAGVGGHLGASRKSGQVIHPFRRASHRRAHSACDYSTHCEGKEWITYCRVEVQFPSGQCRYGVKGEFCRRRWSRLETLSYRAKLGSQHMQIEERITEALKRKEQSSNLRTRLISQEALT